MLNVKAFKSSKNQYFNKSILCAFLFFNMASRQAGDSNLDLNSVLERFLSQFLFKEEMYSSPIFNKNDDIEHHLKIIKEKIQTLDLKEKEKVLFLNRSLHSDVKAELQTVENYEQSSKDFEKLSKLLVEVFKRKQSPVTSILQMLDLKQATNQSTRDFLSTVRIAGHRMLYNENEENRQKYLVKAFINGLANKKIY